MGPKISGVTLIPRENYYLFEHSDVDICSSFRGSLAAIAANQDGREGKPCVVEYVGRDGKIVWQGQIRHSLPLEFLWYFGLL